MMREDLEGSQTKSLMLVNSAIFFVFYFLFASIILFYFLCTSYLLFLLDIDLNFDRCM